MGLSQLASALHRKTATAVFSFSVTAEVWKPAMSLRLRATGIHLAGSTAVAAIAWWLVFRLWYPAPLDALAGGTTLFMLLVAVDVVIGPALTAVVASGKKPRLELARDLAVILTLQLSAFGYGLYTMALARPVAIAFEVDLFRVVSAIDVDLATLPAAPARLRSLSWSGPKTIAAVKPTDAAEQLRTIELGLAGIALATLPSHWREYAPHSAAAWAAAMPVDLLLKQRPGVAAAVVRIAAQAGVNPVELRTLPLLARRAEWVVLVAAPDARIVGYLPVNGGD